MKCAKQFKLAHKNNKIRILTQFEKLQAHANTTNMNAKYHKLIWSTTARLKILLFLKHGTGEPQETKLQTTKSQRLYCTK